MSQLNSLTRAAVGQARDSALANINAKNNLENAAFLAERAKEATERPTSYLDSFVRASRAISANADRDLQIIVGLIMGVPPSELDLTPLSNAVTPPATRGNNPDVTGDTARETGGYPFYVVEPGPGQPVTDTTQDAGRVIFLPRVMLNELAQDLLSQVIDMRVKALELMFPGIDEKVMPSGGSFSTAGGQTASSAVAPLSLNTGARRAAA